MIRNYFIIALRNLWRNRLITMINLVGMAIGFGVFLSFWSWVRFDLSVDRFHQDIDRMYLLFGTLQMEDSEYTTDRTGGIFASALPENFPQVESSCRIFEFLEFELGIPSGVDGDDEQMKYIHEDRIIAADSNFFDFFTFNLVQGNRDLLFSEPNHLVITEELAGRLFGDSDPMNRTVRIGEEGYYTVAGVAEDPPENSSYQFSAVVDFSVLERMGFTVDGSGGNIYYSNFKLVEEADLKSLNADVNAFIEERYDPEIHSRFFFEPLTRKFLYGESREIIGLITFLIMGLIVLSVACINFINLTTAYASTRIKEISIRKSAGASKGQLIMQFLGETYILLLLAIYLGFFIAEHLTPVMYRAFEVGHGAPLSGITFWIQVVVIYIVTGLLAGLYPAIKIAGFKPLAYLSSRSMQRIHERKRARRILIVLQFTFSIAFILVSLFMNRQHTHLMEADLGFNREDVLYIRTNGRAWEEYPGIREELSAMHFVQGVSSASNIPVWIDRGEIEWGAQQEDRNKIAAVVYTDAGFLETFEIALLEGEYFTLGRDSLNREYVVINRVLADQLGWDDPVGRTFYLFEEGYQVLGVTENIDFFPFNLDIFQEKALMYFYHPVSNYIFVRLQKGTTGEQIASLESVFQKYNPGYEFIHDFVSNYRYPALDSGEGIKFIFMLFSVLAIFIAGIGLIGLSLHNSHSRTKEVGIRKVMGAQTGLVLRLLLSDFLRLVVLANLIGMPLAFLILKRILRLFSYTIDLKTGVFVMVFFLSILLALVTVTFQAYRTARSNPVNSLRYE